MSINRYWGFEDSITAEPGTTGVRVTAGRPGSEGASRGSVYLDHGLVDQTTYTWGFAVRFEIYNELASIRLARSSATNSTPIRLFADGAAGWQMMVGTTSTPNAVAPPSVPLPLTSTWYYVELSVRIGDAATALVVLRVDGVEVIRHTGTALLDTRAASLYLDVSSTRLTFDDVYHCTGLEEFLGDVQVRHHLPDGNGASSQWTGSDGNQVDNYQLVDEGTPNANDYVAASTGGLVDLYAMADLPTSPPTEVLAVSSMARITLPTSGTSPRVAPLLRGALGGINEGDALAPSTSGLTAHGPALLVDPDGNPWTTARFDALQVGVKSIDP